MEQDKLNLLRNFWVLGRKAQDASTVLAIPLDEVQRLYRQWNERRENMARNILRLRGTVLLVLSLVTAGSLRAQGVTPIVAEFGGHHARGHFTVTNDSVRPIAVTVEATSLTFDKGAPTWSPLSADVHVKLSESSVRVGPKSSHDFEYEVTCPASCAVTFKARLVVAQRADGVRLAVTVPSTVYVCEKQKDCRQSVIGATP